MSEHDNTYAELCSMVEGIRDEMLVAYELTGHNIKLELARAKQSTTLDMEKAVVLGWEDDEDLTDEWFGECISLRDWMNARAIDGVQHAQRRLNDPQAFVAHAPEWTTTHFDITFCTGGPAIWAEIHEGYGYLKGVWGTDTITRTIDHRAAAQAFEDLTEEDI